MANQFQLSVFDGKNEQFKCELSYEMLVAIVNNYPDIESSRDFYALCASHPSNQVREAVASKEHLSEATVALLGADRETCVLSSLLYSQAGRQYLSHEAIVNIANKESQLAERIAGYVTDFQEANTNELVNLLAEHSDPQVRRELAGNSSVNKKVLKKLTADQDLIVAHYARQSLSY